MFFLALVEDVVAAAAAAADWLRESLDNCWIGVAILGSCTAVACASIEDGLEEEGLPLRAGLSIIDEEAPLLFFERLAGTDIGCWVYTDACWSLKAWWPAAEAAAAGLLMS